MTYFACGAEISYNHLTFGAVSFISLKFVQLTSFSWSAGFWSTSTMLYIHNSSFLYIHTVLKISLHWLLTMFFRYNAASLHYKNSVSPVCCRVRIYIYLIVIFCVSMMSCIITRQTKSSSFVSQILLFLADIYLFLLWMLQRFE